MDNSLIVLTIVLVFLAVRNIVQEIRFSYERKKYLNFIDRLTDKVMSKNYSDYVYGQEVKRDEPVLETYRPRDDRSEAEIEAMRKEQQVKDLEKTAKVLDDQLEEVGTV